MNSRTSKILIETMLRKAIKDIKDSPKRSSRNLIDMALQFSNGRFQKRFFLMAQNMLKNENSPYYGLAHDIVNHVDTQRLVTFGMNIGYNSCTQGAKKIREIEEKQGFDIPWSVAFQIAPEIFSQRKSAYHSVIEQGEKMGIYTWQIYAESGPECMLSLAARHPDSAFIFYCEPADITEAFLEYAAELYNLMLVVRYDENSELLYDSLREMGLLYSVYCRYSEDDLNAIFSGELFMETQQVQPIFTALVSDSSCSEKIRSTVYSHIRELREKQIFSTLPWEIVYDNRYIDSIISNEPCSALFDHNGCLNSIYGEKQEEYNMFDMDLCKILVQAFPKSRNHNISIF